MTPAASREAAGVGVLPEGTAMDDKKLESVPFEPGEKVHDVRTGHHYWIVKADPSVRLRVQGPAPDGSVAGYFVSDRWRELHHIPACLLAAGHPRPTLSTRLAILAGTGLASFALMRALSAFLP